MNARLLVVVGMGTLAFGLVGGSSPAATVKKCPKGKVARVTNGKRVCVPAKRFVARSAVTSASASALRTALTSTSVGLRRKDGRPIPRLVSPQRAAQIAGGFTQAESKLRAGVRAAQAQKGVAHTNEIVISSPAVTQNANGSVTGRAVMTESGSANGLAVALEMTGHPTGRLDIGVDFTVADPSGNVLTKGLTIRDLTGGKNPECPVNGADMQATGGADGTSRSQESFGGKNVKLGTIREGTTFTVKSRARAALGADGRLQPITVTVTASADYSRSAQALAFFGSRTRVVATGSMTGKIDPVTGQLSGGTVSSNVRSSGFGSAAASAETTFRNLIEQQMREEVERLRKKFADAAKDCAGYDVTLALTTNAEFATHSSTGAINATLTTSGSAAGPFTASGPMSYANVTFSSKIAECHYEDTVLNPLTLTVTIKKVEGGNIEVTWDAAANGVSTTATVVCIDPGPPVRIDRVPGMAGVNLLTPSPTTFELPPDGGQVAIGGGFQSGGDGWAHTGTVTVKRHTR